MTDLELLAKWSFTEREMPSEIMPDGSLRPLYTREEWDGPRAPRWVRGGCTYTREAALNVAGLLENILSEVKP